MALPGGSLIRFGRRAQPAAEGPNERDFFAAMPTPLVVVDGEGRVQRANAAAEMLFNSGQPALAGKPLAALIGLADAHPAIAGVAADAPFAAYDVELTLAPRRHHRADLLAAPLPEHPGWRIVAIHGSAHSVVNRRADRHGGTLTAVAAAAMLAHEIKNPLSGIRGAAQLLEASADKDSIDLTRLIRNEVDRVAALIDRMEGFTDTRALDVSPQNIHAILGHAREVALSGFARGLPIRELYDPSLPPVLGHKDSLIQVIINLLKNAAEAIATTRRGGAITLTTAYRHGVSVAAQRGDGRVPLPIEVCVIDDGPGPPDGIAEHLFDPFVTSKKTGGGLGLTLVEKLIRDQGGIVEYAREGEPPRTVFRLLLPRAGGKA
ncbi:MAG: PAS domain-containing protein [Sphingomonadaceae bacterium]|nr:PAS domain-containing protein [Sphingomonadaceae bacterium]